MAKFTDLPAEILENIAEEVGGRNLRRNVDNLLLNRQWYDAAKATYHSGLELTNIRVYGCDVAKLGIERKSFKHRTLVQKNTRVLSLRLLGHWWDENSKAALDAQPDVRQFDREATMNEYPPEFDSNPILGVGRALRAWQDDTLTPVLTELFADLHDLHELEEIKLETVLDVEETHAPQVPFIRSSLIASFLRNLPLTQSLKKLTLDLCSGIDYDESESVHICDELSPILHRIEIVHLRLRWICHKLFQLPSNVTRDDIRLKTLILKMVIPFFSGGNRHIPSLCFSSVASQSPMNGKSLEPAAPDIILTGKFAVSKVMIRAATRYREAIEKARYPAGAPDDVFPTSGMDAFRISHTASFSPMVNIADIHTMENVDFSRPLNAYMDVGWPYWFESHTEGARRWPLVLGQG